MSVIGSNILAGASGGAGAGGYEIERSLRFNSGDSAYLNKTSVSGNRKTWTYSVWVKRSKLSTYQALWSTGYNGTNYSIMYFNTDDQLFLQEYRGTTQFQLKTAAKFRDLSAWYHVVLVFDSTQSTDSNKQKIYINGQEQATTGTLIYPTLNYDSLFNAGYVHAIGRNQPYTNFYLDGYLADIHFIDGQALAPTDFGELDDNNVWQPIEYAGTYGTNGFHLDFADNSSNAALGTDTSGNSNTWTVNNLSAETALSLPGVNFDGTGDYLAVADSSDFHFSTNDFTIECYVKPAVITGNREIVGQRAGGTVGAFTFYQQAAVVQFYASTGTGWTINTKIADLVLNQWTHLAAVRDGNNFKLYQDGVLKTTVTSTGSLQDNASPLSIGANQNTAHFNGVISNLRIVKGTAVYTSAFTRPSTPLANVTNTVLLCCQSDTSTTAAAVTPSSLVSYGDPVAGTYSNVVTANNDSLVDTPTNGDTASDTGAGGEVVGNYATLNPLTAPSAITLSNGNLDFSTSASNAKVLSTIGMSSGKFYWEAVKTSGSNGNFGISTGESANTAYAGSDAYSWGFATDGNKYHNASGSSYGSSWGTNDVIGVAFDADAGSLYYYINGVAQNSGTAAFTGLTSGPYFASAGDHSCIGNINFGSRPFAYTAPSGYKALCTSNLPTPTIADGSKYFDAKLYAGTGSTQALTMANSELSPDFVWIKNRGSAQSHALFDVVRGATKGLHSDLTQSEWTDTNTLTAFNSNGFTLNGHAVTNASSNTYVGWAWDAGSSNTTIAAGGLNSSVYDQSQNWAANTTYSESTAAGTIYSMWDGDTSTRNGSNAAASYETTFSPTLSGIVRVYAYSSGQRFRVNDGLASEETITTTAAGWHSFSTNFTSISTVGCVSTTGVGYATYAWEIGGKLMIDPSISITNNFPSIASTVRANPSAGFSIVSYSGVDTPSTNTVAHGLNVAPSVYIIKNRTSTGNWVYNTTVIDGSVDYMFLNATNAKADQGSPWNTLPTSSVFTLGANDANTCKASNDYIAYCFAPVEGYSAMGSYTGNGSSSDGPFVYTGFKVAFLMVKNASTGGETWTIYDATRDPYNLATNRLRPNTPDAESSGTAPRDKDFLSNGFKIRGASGEQNTDGNTYIYLAFASNPFASNGGLAR